MQRFTIIVYITLSRIYSINPYRGITFPSPIHHRPPYKYPLLITLNPERQKRNTRAPRPTHTRAGVTGAQRKREKRPTTHTYTHTRESMKSTARIMLERESFRITQLGRYLTKILGRPLARACSIPPLSCTCVRCVRMHCWYVCTYICGCSRARRVWHVRQRRRCLEKRAIYIYARGKNTARERRPAWHCCPCVVWKSGMKKKRMYTRWTLIRVERAWYISKSCNPIG